MKNKIENTFYLASVFRLLSNYSLVKTKRDMLFFCKNV